MKDLEWRFRIRGIRKSSMKKILTATIISLLVLASACSNKSNPSASSNNSNQVGTSNPSQAAAPATQSPAPANPDESSQPGPNAPQTNPAQRLLGTFEVIEVHTGGVINMISSSKTVISFFTNGTYSRVSRQPTKPDHRDAGGYRIAGDKLVLMIKMSEGKIFNPPREVTHTFELSPDGEELRLTSSKGTVAVFHRTTRSTDH
jgi:hypothetical protein